MSVSQNIVHGLAAGCVYGLVAMGLVIIYRASNIVHFAYGSFSMAAVYAAFALSNFGVPTKAALLLSIAFGAGLSVACHHLFLGRLAQRSTLAMVMATFALAMVLEGLVGALFGHEPRMFLGNERVLHPLGALVLFEHDAWILVATFTIALALHAFFRWTDLGLALRAVADNPLLARIQGVDPMYLATVAWGLSGALGALAALLIVPRTFLEPTMMLIPVLKAFSALVLGGLRSPFGALAGGCVLGVIEALIGAYVSTDLQSVFAFVVILLVLWQRPSGLFEGSKGTHAP